jgi:two-component system response regulator FixJ
LPRKVCLVDDDEAVRDSMRVLLESYGIAVQDYASARDFLSKGQSDRSECMLLDLHMPEMDGLELLEAMRKQGSSLPVIVITGRGDAQLSSRVIQAGAYTLLNKPVEDDLLLQSIASAVERAQPAAVSAAS